MKRFASYLAVALLAPLSVGEARAADWCAASHSPWPGGVWDPETCFYLKPNADGSINVTASFTPSGTQDVNVTQTAGVAIAKGSGTAATAIRVELPTNGTGVVTAAQATAASLNATVVGTGTFAVQAAQSGTFTVQPGNTANTTPWLVSLQQTASTASANVTATVVSVKNSAGVWQDYEIGSQNASACYLQIFDLATGSVTLGTTAPLKSILIPANGGANVARLGWTFAAAISVAATTTRAGSSACATGLDVNVGYN